MIRAQAQAVLDQWHGLPVAMLLQGNVAQRKPSLHARWKAPDGLSQINFRLIILPQLPVDCAQSQDRRRIAWLETSGGLVMTDGTLEIALLPGNIAKEQLALPGIRVGLYQPCEGI